MNNVTHTSQLLTILQDKIDQFDGAKSGALDIFGDRVEYTIFSEHQIKTIKYHLAAIKAGRDIIDMSYALTPAKR